MERFEYDQFLNGSTPTEIAEYLKIILPDLGDVDAEEVLLQQESAYEYIKSNRQEKETFDYGQSSNSNAFLESQVTYDEAIAQSLMVEDAFNDLHISQPLVSSLGNDNTRSNVTEPPVASTEHDEIDPDKMTYEQLLSLEDAVGHESKGLSKEATSRLPTSKYKLCSSKKKEKEECVICCVEFEQGAEVITLPCAHCYHSDCITKWLEVKKYCPVCQKEVQN